MRAGDGLRERERDGWSGGWGDGAEEGQVGKRKRGPSTHKVAHAFSPLAVRIPEKAFDKIRTERQVDDMRLKGRAGHGHANSLVGT